VAGCGQVAGKRRVDGVEQRMVAGTNGDWAGSSGAWQVAAAGRWLRAIEQLGVVFLVGQAILTL
jgi:hypothetical protein